MGQHRVKREEPKGDQYKQEQAGAKNLRKANARKYTPVMHRVGDIITMRDGTKYEVMRDYSLRRLRDE